MNCKGLHCNGCGKGGISGGAILVIIIFALIVTHAHEIDKTTDEVVKILEYTLISIASLIALLISAFVTYKITMHKRNRHQEYAIQDGRINEIISQRNVQSITSCKIIPGILQETEKEKVFRK